MVESLPIVSGYNLPSTQRIFGDIQRIIFTDIGDINEMIKKQIYYFTITQDNNAQNKFRSHNIHVDKTCFYEFSFYNHTNINIQTFKKFYLNLFMLQNESEIKISSLYVDLNHFELFNMDLKLSSLLPQYRCLIQINNRNYYVRNYELKDGILHSTPNLNIVSLQVPLNSHQLMKSYSLSILQKIHEMCMKKQQCFQQLADIQIITQSTQHQLISHLNTIKLVLLSYMYELNAINAYECDEIVWLLERYKSLENTNTITRNHIFEFTHNLNINLALSTQLRNDLNEIKKQLKNTQLMLTSQRSSKLVKAYELLNIPSTKDCGNMVKLTNVTHIMDVFSKILCFSLPFPVIPRGNLTLLTDQLTAGSKKIIQLDTVYENSSGQCENMVSYLQINLSSIQLQLQITPKKSNVALSLDEIYHKYKNDSTTNTAKGKKIFTKLDTWLKSKSLEGQSILKDRKKTKPDTISAEIILSWSLKEIIKYYKDN